MSLRKLTQAELERYHEQGYVVVEDVFPPSELQQIDEEIDRLLADKSNEGHHAGWVMQLAERSEAARRFAEDERNLALIEEIVKPGIAIHSVKLAAKLPHSSDVCHWHQDDGYYFDGTPEKSSKTRMSTWVPLQASDPENGCLWVVPGSHKWGLKEHGSKDWGQCKSRAFKEDLEAKANELAIPVPVEAGSVVLFSALLWHHSKGNSTDRVRRAFIISYQEATVKVGAPGQYRVLRPAS